MTMRKSASVEQVDPGKRAVGANQTEVDVVAIAKAAAEVSDVIGRSCRALAGGKTESVCAKAARQDIQSRAAEDHVRPSRTGDHVSAGTAVDSDKLGIAPLRKAKSC